MKRTLKIEEITEAKRSRDGAIIYGTRTIPRVRLRGKWLQAAGFNPGAHLELTVVAAGVIELRVCGPVQLKAQDFTTATEAPKFSQAARRSWARKAVQS